MSRQGRSGAGASQRRLRVGEALRHALADILLRGELRDPDLRGVSITVSEVRVSPDLRNAECYVLPLGGVDADRVLAALRRSTPHIRGLVARAVRLKYMPALRFEADRSFEQAERIEALLRAERGRRPNGTEDPTDDGP